MCLGEIRRTQHGHCLNCLTRIVMILSESQLKFQRKIVKTNFVKPAQPVFFFSFQQIIINAHHYRPEVISFTHNFNYKRSVGEQFGSRMKLITNKQFVNFTNSYYFDNATTASILFTYILQSFFLSKRCCTSLQTDRRNLQNKQFSSLIIFSTHNSITGPLLYIKTLLHCIRTLSTNKYILWQRRKLQCRLKYRHLSETPDNPVRNYGY